MLISTPWDSLKAAREDVFNQTGRHLRANRASGAFAMNLPAYEWLQAAIKASKAPWHEHVEVAFTNGRFCGLLVVVDENYHTPAVVEVGAAKQRWPGLPWIVQ